MPPCPVETTQGSMGFVEALFDRSALMHKCLSSTGALWRVQFCNYERDHPGDGLHQEGEARNKTSSPISPTEVDEGTRSSPGTAMGEGRQQWRIQGGGGRNHLLRAKKNHYYATCL